MATNWMWIKCMFTFVIFTRHTMYPGVPASCCRAVLPDPAKSQSSADRYRPSRSRADTEFNHQYFTLWGISCEAQCYPSVRIVAGRNLTKAWNSHHFSALGLQRRAAERMELPGSVEASFYCGSWQHVDFLIFTFFCSPCPSPPNPPGLDP